MSAPREDILHKVREWIGFAEEDLRLAEHALSMPDPCPFRLVAYHAQQCAEKYLKAYLVFRTVDFPFTHNISTLVELYEEVAGHDAELDDADELTQYAVSVRYPGISVEVTRLKADRAIALARRVVERVRDAMAHNGFTT